MGEPPKTGRYEIHEAGELIRFVLSWTDTESKPFQMEFTANPDGQPHPFENPALADSIQVGYQGETILESWSFKDGTTLGYAKRELIAGGAKMIVSQEVDTAEGKIVNRSTYRRL